MEISSSNGYTVGIGLTDRCNARCPHCYSRPEERHHDLNYDSVRKLVNAIPIKSVNFGTGESILYPQFIDIVEMFVDRGIDVAVTTNGSTIMALPDEVVSLFHDVDFSIDFPDPKMNDLWRGVGSFEVVMKGVRRCQELGVEVSLVACLMKENSTYMGRLARLAVDMGLNLRVNVYKSVATRKHRPTYEEFWSAIQDISAAAYFSACSEPVVCAAIGMQSSNGGSPCGRMSFRVHPDGAIVPCVYLKESPVQIQDMITDFETQQSILEKMVSHPLPEICRDCEGVEACNGGCASRRILNNPNEPDEYCFKVRGDRPRIEARWRKSKNLVHENYLCTMIFSG